MLIDNSDLSRIIYHALASEFDIEAVVREAKMPRQAFLRQRLKKLGWRKVLGQILFAKCVVPLLRREASGRRAEILKQYEMNESPIPPERVIDVSSMNDMEAVALLQKLSPQVVVVNGTRILGAKVLDATEAIFLNTHVGITPLYRGVHGGYWALASDDPEHCGVTIHRIDSGIDTGAIIAQALIRPMDGDNFTTYPLLQIASAIPLLKKAVFDALHGGLELARVPAGESKLWSHPTALEYLRGRIGRGIR